MATDRLSDLPHAAFLAYDLLPQPVWLCSAKTLQILASNAAAQQWLGYDAKALQRMTISDVSPEEDRARLIEQVRQCDVNPDNPDTWTVVTKAGDRYIVACSWRKVLYDGTPAILASIRDMTQVAPVLTEAETGVVEPVSQPQDTRLFPEQVARLFKALPGKMLVLTPGAYVITAATEEYARAAMTQCSALLNRQLFDVLPDDPDEPEADGVRNLRASLRRVEALHLTDVMNIQRHPVRGSDGAFQERFWLSQNKPVFDQSGDLISIIHRTEDVTEVLTKASLISLDRDRDGDTEPDKVLPVVGAQTVALQALQERQIRLHTAERLLNIGSWEYDLGRKTHSWSKRVFEIYGLPQEQAAPDLAGYIELVHPDDRQQIVSTYTAFANEHEPEVQFEHRIIRADGAVAYVRGVGARHQLEGREVIIGFVQDVTRFKEAEEKLENAARLRKAAGKLARLGSWRVDITHPRIEWGEGTAAIHDQPPGTSPTLEEAFSYYVPQHRDRIRAQFDACVQDGRPFNETLQIVTAKGRPIWVRALGEPVRNATGQIIAVEGAFQDISDLVAARDKSDALSVRLHQTLEHISDAFFLLDHQWRFSFLNSQAEVLLQRSREALAGNVIWQEFPEADGTLFRTEYERAVDQQQSVRFQEFYPSLEAWFEVNAHPTPEGLAVYFHDVTQQRARDRQLRLLEDAVSRQNDILLITEAEPMDAPDGPKIVYVNDAFERHTGFSRDEVMGLTPRVLQGPKTQREELKRIHRAMQKWQPVTAELINYTKAGKAFWMELDIVPLADETGRFTHWISVERDITQRKKAEEALRVNEERFRLISKATGNAVWEWDILAQSWWWSEGLRDIFGHKPDNDAAASSIWDQCVHPDDKARLDAALDRLQSGQITVFHEHYRFRRADGTWADVDDRAFSMRDTEGKVIRILGSMTDISERLRLEDQLRQAKKMVSVGQLTGGVAHDFNNLLTIVLGNAEILTDKLNDQPDLQALAEMIVNAADRGAELTHRLLAFARRQPLSPAVLDVSHLIYGMEGLLRRTLPENIDLEIVRAGGVWKTEVDAGQLEAALLNIVLNARDAMPDGGSLTIETANAALDDGYVAQEMDVKAGQYVLIVITDTGHGIPAHIIGQVFEPFFTTKEAGQGSGLGLSMVYGFIKQSGGHIRVYSEPGDGTSFKLYLPRSHAKGTQVQIDRARRTIIGGRETILVVEDDGSVRAQVVAQLKDLGYRIFAASAGAEALDILNQHQGIDLLFTDVIMPGGMNGRQLADAARANVPDLKVLFTSGYSENSIVHNGKLDPGVELLSKPYRREQLALKIRKVLDQG